jgi:hypothetical protein
MKKRVKKLSLYRETLRHLQEESFGKQVVGGDTTQNCEEASHCACDPTYPETACFGSCSCSWQPC